jgi:putative aldouronate transport system substrate-binding protein
MFKRCALLSLLCLAGFGTGWAEGQMETTSTGRKVREFTIFVAREMDNYPREGTFLGKWTTEKTAAKMKWTFPVGDVRQKIGLLNSSRTYPDLIDARNDNQLIYDARGFIPLDDLIAKYGVHAKKLYGDRIHMLRRTDGHIYWLPSLFPYGDKLRQTKEPMGLYVQKRVLKDLGWPVWQSLEEAADALIAYARKNPVTNGKKTLVFTALTRDWREFAFMNAPHVFSGHPNDGVANVDFENGRWQANMYYDAPEAYKVYKIYNKIHQAGLFDTEAFVADYDQYLARIAQGNVLAFCDQRWQIDQPNNLLKKQGGDLWYVGLPVTMAGYREEMLSPLGGGQVSEGVGISVNCKDPVLAFQWLDYLASEEFQILKQWGVKGENYLVDADGLFYRTPEMIKKWKDSKWRDKVFGQRYFCELVCWDHSCLLSDGKNSVNPINQPSVFQADLYETEREVLKAYHKGTWTEFFNQPDNRRMTYYPLWTIKIPTGGDIDIAYQKIMEARRKYTPALVMAPDGKYDALWKEYLDALKRIHNRDKYAQFYQDEMEKRLRANGALK